MNCPNCSRPFYPTDRAVPSCRCDPVMVRDMLIAQLDTVGQQHPVTPPFEIPPGTTAFNILMPMIRLGQVRPCAMCGAVIAFSPDTGRYHQMFVPGNPIHGHFMEGVL